ARRRALVPMAIAWTGIVDSIWLEWAHVSEYERWIDEFHRFEDDFRRELPPPLWFSVLRGILAATCYGRPLDPGLGRLEREAETALCGEMPDTERVMLAGQLMFLNTWQFGRRDGAARVMSVMAQRPESIARASPLARCVWQTFSSLWNLLFEADLEASLAEARTGRELILEHGISTWDNAVPPLQAALCFEDRENLDDWMAWFLRADPKANRPFYDTFQAHFMAGQAWLRGDVHEAVGHCRQSLLAAERHGSVVIFSAFRALLAACLAESGQLREALREAARARRIRAGFPSDFLDLMMYLPLARIPLLAGRSRRALPALRRAFEAGARQRMFFPLMVRRDELAMLCGLALQAGITPDYAAWLIRARDLAPPDDPGIRMEWPWRCRIHVLGRFDVEVDGQVNDTRPKARQRMHALLSQLILAGPEGIEQEALAERLWPDSPPERALNSLHVTIHRLRDFLREPALLRTHGGRVALCADRVWVDLWEFERLAALADRLDLPLLRRLVGLYGGAARLEPADDLDLQLRQAALLQAFERLALRVGLELEPVDPERSQGHYRAALSHSPLQDELWAGLLRCDAVLGGLGAVERTWGLLSGQYRESLDMEPPARLKTLYERLLAQLAG
ncbi:AfsR/SARP family transcriptional regulator, partial [Thioalkalivibrio denitrificans]